MTAVLRDADATLTNSVRGAAYVARNIVPVAFDIVGTGIGALGGCFAGYYIADFLATKVAKAEGEGHSKGSAALFMAIPFAVTGNAILGIYLLPPSWAAGYLITSTVAPVAIWSIMYFLKENPSLLLKVLEAAGKL